MRQIEKGAAPRELRQWFEGQPIVDGRRINCTYEQGLPTEIKDTIRRRLLAEQGGLCCYTGLRIDLSSSHIEHLKPQNQCHDHEDVDYNNMLAAYPLKKSGERGCPYGAHAKVGWYSPDLFIGPLTKQCETSFRFDLEGRVFPADNGNRAAVETIRRLRLDHHSLAEMREQAIEEVFFTKNRRLSEAQLRTLAERGFCSKDEQGRYPLFCFVIQQAAEQLLRKAARERARRQALGDRGRS